VVITHDAAHPGSLPSRHAHLACFDASDLTPLLPVRGPDLWVHGHVHRYVDYHVGRTRIVCNARGHAKEETGFQADLAVTPFACQRRNT
jgi:hypothetical protein